jgi:broad specificity phosphatase PhoE
MSDIAEISPSTSPPGIASKKIYLIRHAESEENRRIAAFCRSFQKLKQLSLPTASDVSKSTELLNVSAQVDSNVSEIGANQIAHMGGKLQKDNFVETSGIDLVVHSPLLRARQTSEGMLGCMTASTVDDTIKEKKAESVSRVVETDLLLEKKPAEWTPMYFDNFVKRISAFESWLRSQPEETIAIVGHSQYFKKMLGLDDKFGNCEVWKVDFCLKQSGEDETQNASTVAAKESDDNTAAENELDSVSSWSNLEKVYGCEIESSPKYV